MEIKNVSTGSISIDYLFKTSYWVNNEGHNAVVKDNKIILFRSDWHENNKFDIYDITTATWSIGILPDKILYSSIIAVNNTIYVLGGFAIYTGQPLQSNQVWKLEF